HESVEALRAGAETVLPGPGPTPCATAAETELVLRWLESDGVRLIHVDGEWSCPVDGATRHLGVFDAAEHARAALAPFDEHRTHGWRTEHQPARP
ncbi:MAG: DEDD exonuclease domain-containing protein, partial [Nocardioidaceae bacterium]